MIPWIAQTSIGLSNVSPTPRISLSGLLVDRGNDDASVCGLINITSRDSKAADGIFLIKLFFMPTLSVLRSRKQLLSWLDIANGVP
jgi:hypothetical protein